ncbi:SUKH-4 family immunity protein [Streptomyces sp. NPDC007325]|uniref:SUKH-4 family immunity protein n=1 Tax=Streptomyces sp. NPDC007325 TaxID=3154588 RepID=UPI00341160F1
MTPQKMMETYGLQNITFFPQPPTIDCHTPFANQLSNIGLPHSEVFISREKVPNPYPGNLDFMTLEIRFTHLGIRCPAESRTWWALGYLFESLVAVDPESGKVYAFPGGEAGYTELHRDVESLLFTLVEFRRLEVDHDNDVDPEALSARFRQVVGGFDSTPFADEDSPWNLSLEELEHGIW